MVTLSDVTIAIATFGDGGTWQPLAQRAKLSALEQRVGAPVLCVHGDSLEDTRNRVLERVETEFVIYLDADDTLDRDYVDAMTKVTGDVRAPAVTFVIDGGGCRPRMLRVSGHEHDCSAECLPFGNWIVIGAMARTQLLRDVGGWRAWDVYEDWDLWLRCHLAGADITPVPDAVYEAWVRQGSRNRAGTAADRMRTHRDIARANGVPVPA